MNRKTYNQTEIDHFKQNMMDYQTFKHMDQSQQAELITHWESTLKIKEIAELLGITSDRIYNLRYHLKKRGHLEDTRRAKTRKKNKKAKSKKESEPAQQIKPLEVVEEDTGDNVKDAEPVTKPSDEPNIFDYPSEYVNQVYEEPQVKRIPDDNHAKVSLDEFMKMVEIQEKIAKAVEVKQEQDADGFNFKFNGNFSSSQLEKRLKKVLAMVEDEPCKYAVRFELVELEQESEDTDDQTDSEKDELLEEVNELRDKMQVMQREMEDNAKSNNRFNNWAAGYQALQSDRDGMHHPKSEFDKRPFIDGIKESNGRTLYQTFYICPDCNNKGKHFIPYATVYVDCHECGKRLRTRDSVADGSFQQDSFGNYYIAGNFKRADEIERERRTG